MGSPTPPPRRPLPPLPPRPGLAARPSVATGAPLAPGSPTRPALPSRPALPQRPAADRPSRPRPDPTGLRVAIAFGGLAAASALATTFLAPAISAATATTSLVATDAGPVQHVIQYVQLQPGQTPPANASVVQAPAPTPRIVTVTTRQSGLKK